MPRVNLSLKFHLFFVIFIYLILYALLRIDPRVSHTVGQDTLRRLGVDGETFAFRASRFNAYQVEEPFRHGPGEQGRGVDLHLSTKEIEKLIDKDGYNSRACSRISLDRSLGMKPAPECLAVQYPSGLPMASVILIFYNEPVRLILRTVFSIVNRTPPALLKEVILLNDGSTRDSLLYSLDEFVNRTWPDHIVRIVRLSERSGLIRARIAGAKAATGDVIVFLDAHCEVTFKWLEPLLSRIHEKPDAVVCPAIANIDKLTLTFFRSDAIHDAEGFLKLRVGTFGWDGFFVFEQPPRSVVVNRRRNTDPLNSIAMAGGLFAMRRDYFFKLGAYDEGMEIWGGENLEMSFRIWQCGGSLEFSPCSTVGHVFRSNQPYEFPSKKDFHGYNTVRLAEVWMDEYKENFYLARQDLQGIDYGNVSSRKQLRDNLNCKSFDWFLTGPAAQKFVYSKAAFGYGSLCSNDTPMQCLLREPLGLEYRKLTLSLLLTLGPIDVSQFKTLFALTETGFLRKDWACVRTRRIWSVWVLSEHMLDLEVCPKDFDQPDEERYWLAWQKEQAGLMEAVQQRSPLSGAQAVRTTNRKLSNFRWAYDKRNGKLINAQTGKCLDSGDGTHPVTKPCVDGSPSQSWRFSRSKNT